MTSDPASHDHPRSPLESISVASRVAAADEAVGLDEVALAARNHGMPLEAMRYDVTPLGLHYPLTHYDIPLLDAGTWRLEVGGLVGRATGGPGRRRDRSASPG